MAGNGNGSGTGNGKADGAARKPITVLIVDDERTFGEALEVALDREKDLRVVHVATDGVEAIASATECASAKPYSRKYAASPAIRITGECPAAGSEPCIGGKRESPRCGSRSATNRGSRRMTSFG